MGPLIELPILAIHSIILKKLGKKYKQSALRGGA
jgi:hypothetical protein